MNVANPRARIDSEQGIADSMNEVRLAKTDAALQKQRVEGNSGTFRHMERGSTGHLVCFALEPRRKRQL